MAEKCPLINYPLGVSDPYNYDTGIPEACLACLNNASEDPLVSKEIVLYKQDAVEADQELWVVKGLMRLEAGLRRGKIEVGRDTLGTNEEDLLQITTFEFECRRTN